MRTAPDRSATRCCGRAGEAYLSHQSAPAGGGLAVSDDEACAGVAYAARTLKLVVEPGGAVALAALLTGKIDVRGKSVGVVLTGGNIDPPLLADILCRYPG
jgi:threonine dehydratase